MVALLWLTFFLSHAFTCVGIFYGTDSPYVNSLGFDAGTCDEVQAPCILGKCQETKCTCNADTDCMEGRCILWKKDTFDQGVYTCNTQMGSCEDFLKNGEETDIDCGGPMCSPCTASQKCSINSDCVSGTCQLFLGDYRCVGCSDGLQNGLETDIDCGGDCGICGVDKKCSRYILEDDALLYELSGQASQYNESGSLKLARKISDGHCKLWYAEGTNNTWKSDVLRDKNRLAQKVALYRHSMGWSWFVYENQCGGQIEVIHDDYIVIPDVTCFLNQYVGDNLEKLVFPTTFFTSLVHEPWESLSFVPNNKMAASDCADHCKDTYNSDMFYMSGGNCGCCEPPNDGNDAIWQSDYSSVPSYIYPNGRRVDFTTYHIVLTDMPQYSASCSESIRASYAVFTDTQCSDYCIEHVPGSWGSNDNLCECVLDTVQEGFGERPRYYYYEELLFVNECLEHCKTKYPDVRVEVVYDETCACRQYHQPHGTISETQQCYDSCQNPTEWTDKSCRTGVTDIYGMSNYDCSILGPNIYTSEKDICTFDDGSVVYVSFDNCHRCRLPDGSVSTTLSNADCEFNHNGWVETGSHSTDPSTCKLLDNSIVYGLSSGGCSQLFTWSDTKCEFSNGEYTEGLTKPQCDEKQRESVTFFMKDGSCFCCSDYDCEDKCSKTNLLFDNVYEYTCRSCSDGVKNGGETDVDCGGDIITGCDPCTGSKACGIDKDCQTGGCVNGFCIDCNDNVKNGDESDIDCGGSCTGCPVGNACVSNSDCDGYCDQYCELNSVKFYDITESDCTYSYTPSRCYIKDAGGNINVLETGGPRCTGYLYDESMCVLNGKISYNVHADDCVAVFHRICESCTDGIKGSSEPEIDKGKYCTKVGLYGLCYLDEDCVSGMCGSPQWLDAECTLRNGTTVYGKDLHQSVGYHQNACADQSFIFVADIHDTSYSLGECIISDGTIFSGVSEYSCRQHQLKLNNFLQTRCMSGNEIVEGISEESCKSLPKRCHECFEDIQCQFKCHNGQCIVNTPGQYMGRDCPTGTYDHDSDAETRCEFCPAGYSSNTVGAGLSSCTLCEKGKQSVAAGVCVDLRCDIHGALPASPVCHGECDVVSGEYTCTECTGRWYGPKCQYYADCNPGEVFNGAM